MSTTKRSTDQKAKSSSSSGGKGAVAGTTRSSHSHDQRHGSQNRRKQHPHKNKNDDEEEDDDAVFDAILRDVCGDPTRCSQAGCVENIQLMRSVCQFCRKAYCFQHAQYELHGCAEAARHYGCQQDLEALRKERNRQQMVQSGTYRSKPVAKEVLQHQLKKKIHEKEADRQRKGGSSAGSG